MRSEENSAMYIPRQDDSLEPIDYLVIGHITCDITPSGPRLGGTATYSALTARALGQRVGIITSWGAEIPLDPLNTIPIICQPAQHSTTFTNQVTEKGRKQIIHYLAQRLDYDLVPSLWRDTPIVHLGPVAQEIDLSLVSKFADAFIGITPQGWLRTWDDLGIVKPVMYPSLLEALPQANAVILSIEDVENEKWITEIAQQCKILVVTHASKGVQLFVNHQVYYIPGYPVTEVDAVGAGDVFATAFFIHFKKKNDPIAAARFANQLAAYSVTRPGIEGIPLHEEIALCREN